MTGPGVTTSSQRAVSFWNKLFINFTTITSTTILSPLFKVSFVTYIRLYSLVYAILLSVNEIYSDYLFSNYMQEPVLNIDLAPTFVELAGLDVPENMDGRSLIYLLRSMPTESMLQGWRKSFIVEYHGNGKRFNPGCPQYYNQNVAVCFISSLESHYHSNSPHHLVILSTTILLF